jgi:hypothetical protein
VLIVAGCVFAALFSSDLGMAIFGSLSILCCCSVAYFAAHPDHANDKHKSAHNSARGPISFIVGWLASRTRFEKALLAPPVLLALLMSACGFLHLVDVLYLSKLN